MNFIGNLQIKKAFLGDKLLTSKNAYVGNKLFINGDLPQPVESESFYMMLNQPVSLSLKDTAKYGAMQYSYDGLTYYSPEFSQKTEEITDTYINLKKAFPTRCILLYASGASSTQYYNRYSDATGKARITINGVQYWANDWETLTTGGTYRIAILLLPQDIASTDVVTIAYRSSATGTTWSEKTLTTTSVIRSGYLVSLTSTTPAYASANSDFANHTTTYTTEVYSATVDLQLGKNYIRSAEGQTTGLPLTKDLFQDLNGKLTAVGGRLYDLIDYNNSNPTSMADESFKAYFSGIASLVSAEKLELPNITSQYCYQDFLKLTNITLPPKVPATSLAYYCYSGMFSKCKQLTATPDLPAMNLAEYCYSWMFEECDALVNFGKLPATVIAQSAYENMFLNAKFAHYNATIAATEIGKSGCAYMFSGCTELIETPHITITNITSGSACYSMFYGCTSLTTCNIELNSNTVWSYCYCNMFYNCSSLLNAPALTKKTIGVYCYLNMFYGCSSLDTIYCTALQDDSTSSATFLWVNGVSSTGTFIKHPDATFWTTGPSGIPTGWTVEDAVIES